MNWSNVRLIFWREVRDQLRDRRTLFMIFLLPLLLYPLLGTSIFQVAQFVREQSTRVLVLGRNELPALPKLIIDPQSEDGPTTHARFAKNLFRDAERARLLDVHFIDERALVPDSAATPEEASAAADKFARQAVQQGDYEVTVYFPAGFAEKLARFREKAIERGADSEAAETLQMPSPRIYYNTAKERSTITYSRVLDVLQRWREALGRDTLAALGVPEKSARPFDLEDEDVAEQTGRRGAAVWSKILPCLLLIWALTGAFYPAVDLCAGEKERGTLETLLISPAERIEIVWGKLLTVMIFSMATSVLNLLSMGMTAQLILSQLKEVGPPPAMAPLWLFLALLPVSALFAALCLALASLARSTKEGQYYLMPVLLVTMPLVLLPLSPGFELNLGNSLIPITGVMLLLRSVLEGNYAEALPYVPIVAGVTLFCCLLAVRWAVDQFNSESVLFREGERLDLGLWLKHLMRDREDTPNVGTAMFCGVLILLVQFFMNVSLARYMKDASFVAVALVTQLAAVATPALLMTVMLVRSPRKTLLLRWPSWAAIPAAVLLAIVLHPVANALQAVVMKLYPLNDSVKQQLEALLQRPNSFAVLLLVVAVVPAICEELAFRGFILSGLRHLGHTKQAIALASIFFALAHSVFQQSILAFVMGLVIGYVAVQTGSLLPGMLFHMTHNALGVLSSQLTPDLVQRHPGLSWLARDPSAVQDWQGLYHWPVVALGAVIAMALLLWFRQLPHARTREEAIQEAIEHAEPLLVAEQGHASAT